VLADAVWLGWVVDEISSSKVSMSYSLQSAKK
jgi:hypothetical protein